jgi:hypothetical protein
MTKSTGRRVLRFAKAAATVSCLLGCVVTAAPGYPLMLDYTGFTWTSSLGGHQRLESVGVLDGFTPEVQAPGETYTYYLSDLILGGDEDLGGGYHLRSYASGRFRIYQSTSAGNRPYSYGVNPVGGTAPAGFVDGLLWLGGNFSDFSLLLDTVHGISSFSGTGTYAEGSFLSMLDGVDLYTFAGLTRNATAAVPTGYSYRVDGQLTASVQPVPEPSSLLLLAAGFFGLAASIRRFQ